MAIDDNKVYGLTGAQLKELPDKVAAAAEAAAPPVEQITGTSTTSVMSQKGVTDVLDQKASQAQLAAVEAEIPTKTSDLTNDSDFATESYVDAAVPDVVDNLNTTSASNALSANQGKVLKGLIDSTAADIPGVINNLTSTSTTDALSAKQGKELSDSIVNISSRGRYLSGWNATTGLPDTEPSSALPYTYHTGDYYIVSHVGTTNYKPTGTSYTGTASTTAETGTVGLNDTYLYDGSVWSLIHTDIPEIAIDASLSSTSRNPVENRAVYSALSGKVDTVSGKGLSTNDYTTTEKDKLAGIASGAEVNVQSNWTQTNTTADDYIKNKPTIPTVNNATLTIQRNGTSVQTFTANSSTDKTANIITPEITVTSTDPGEGSVLPANNFVAVVGNEQVQTADIANGAVTSDKIDWMSMPQIVALGRVDVGTVSGYGDKNTTVTIPTQPNDGYRVFLTRAAAGGYWSEVEFAVPTKTVNQFTVYTHNNSSSQANDVAFFYMVVRPAQS